MEYHFTGRNNNAITVLLPVWGNIGRDLSTDRPSLRGGCDDRGKHFWYRSIEPLLFYLLS